MKIPQNSSLGVLTNMASVGKLVQTDFIMCFYLFCTHTPNLVSLPISVSLHFLDMRLVRCTKKKKTPPCGISERWLLRLPWHDEGKTQNEARNEAVWGSTFPCTCLLQGKGIESMEGDWECVFQCVCAHACAPGKVSCVCSAWVRPITLAICRALMYSYTHSAPHTQVTLHAEPLADTLLTLTHRNTQVQSAMQNRYQVEGISALREIKIC